MTDRTIAYSKPFPSNPYGEGPEPDFMPDNTFRRTTLRKVFHYRKRRRFYERAGQLLLIASIEPWAKDYRVSLVEHPDAWIVVDRDHQCYVKQGPVRRPR